MSSSIPYTAREHSSYLINGNLQNWSGSTAAVHSPILAPDGNKAKPIYLGSTPDMSSEYGMEALRAAQSAYDHGRGEWPTAPAHVRIAAMEKFIALMLPKREEVIELLMWEICKKRSDAEKEFDRTVIYLKETIAEYKNLHREGSHITSVEWHIGSNTPRTNWCCALSGPLQLSAERNILCSFACAIDGEYVCF